MRKPNIENKYDLTPAMIPKLSVDREKVKEPVFWRNNVIDAWCISLNTAKNSRDLEFGTYDEFWIGVYDEDAKEYAGKIRCCFSSYGGMCHYNISSFFDPNEIENEMDLQIQEKAVALLNQLIDEGVFII